MSDTLGLSEAQAHAAHLVHEHGRDDREAVVRDLLDAGHSLDDALRASLWTLENPLSQLAKQAIKTLDDATEELGAPEDSVVEILESAGRTRGEAHDTLEALKIEGDVYEPARRRLKAT